MTKGKLALAVSTAVAGTALAVLGGIGSYSAVRAEAIQHSFGPSAAWTVPAGVDTAIIALVLADLLVTSMVMEMPVLQVAATILSATGRTEVAGFFAGA